MTTTSQLHDLYAHVRGGTPSFYRHQDAVQGLLPPSTKVASALPLAGNVRVTYADASKVAESPLGAAFKAGLGMALAGSIAHVGGNLLGRGFTAAEDRLTFDKDFKEMVKQHPELQRYPKEEVERVFRSIRHFSPEVSKEPLTAGTTALQMLRNRDPQNPGSGPRGDIVLAKAIADTGKVSREHSMAKEHREIGRLVAQGALNAGDKAYAAQKALNGRDAEEARLRAIRIREQDEDERRREQRTSAAAASQAADKARSEAQAQQKIISDIRAAAQAGTITKALLTGRQRSASGAPGAPLYTYNQKGHYTPAQAADMRDTHRLVTAFQDLPKPVRDGILNSLP